MSKNNSFSNIYFCCNLKRGGSTASYAIADTFNPFIKELLAHIQNIQAINIYCTSLHHATWYPCLLVLELMLLMRVLRVVGLTKRRFFYAHYQSTPHWQVEVAATCALAAALTR